MRTPGGKAAWLSNVEVAIINKAGTTYEEIDTMLDGIVAPALGARRRRRT